MSDNALHEHNSHEEIDHMTLTKDASIHCSPFDSLKRNNTRTVKMQVYIKKKVVSVGEFIYTLAQFLLDWNGKLNSLFIAKNFQPNGSQVQSM